jgi:hypothetical protein
MTELMKLRAEVDDELGAVEAKWIQASEALETAA